MKHSDLSLGANLVREHIEELKESDNLSRDNLEELVENNPRLSIEDLESHLSELMINL